MTFIIKSLDINNKTIVISQDKFSSVYHVSLLQVYESGNARTINDNVYADMKKANNRFNYLKREVQKGNL